MTVQKGVVSEVLECHINQIFRCEIFSTCIWIGG